MSKELLSLIDSRKAQVGVIGLGYAGVAVAAALAGAGFRVLGVEKRADRVAKLNAGGCPIDGVEPGLAELIARVTKRARAHLSDRGRRLLARASAGEKSPGRNVLMAGAGVGGHCIPKDPWLLAHGVPFDKTSLIAAARARNESMPTRATARARRSAHTSPSGARR